MIEKGKEPGVGTEEKYLREADKTVPSTRAFAAHSYPILDEQNTCPQHARLPSSLLSTNHLGNVRSFLPPPFTFWSQALAHSKRSARPPCHLSVFFFFSCLAFLLSTWGSRSRVEALALTAAGGGGGRDGTGLRSSRTWGWGPQWRFNDNNPWEKHGRKSTTEDTVGSAGLPRSAEAGLSALFSSPPASLNNGAPFPSSRDTKTNSSSFCPSSSSSASPVFSRSPCVRYASLCTPRHCTSKERLERHLSFQSLAPVSSLSPRRPVSSSAVSALLNTTPLPSSSSSLTPSAPWRFQSKRAQRRRYSKPSSRGLRGFDRDSFSVSASSRGGGSSLHSSSSLLATLAFTSLSPPSRPSSSLSLSLSASPPYTPTDCSFTQSGPRHSVACFFFPLLPPRCLRAALSLALPRRRRANSHENAGTSRPVGTWTCLFLTPGLRSLLSSLPPYSLCAKGASDLSAEDSLAPCTFSGRTASRHLWKDTARQCLSEAPATTYHNVKKRGRFSSAVSSARPSSGFVERGRDCKCRSSSLASSTGSSSPTPPSPDDAPSLSSLSLSDAEAVARDVAEAQSARAAVAAYEAQTSRPSSLLQSTEGVKRWVLGPHSTAVPVRVSREKDEERRETPEVPPGDEEPGRAEAEEKREDLMSEGKEHQAQSPSTVSSPPAGVLSDKTGGPDEKQRTDIKGGKGKLESWEILPESDWHLHPRERFFNEDGTMDYEKAPDTMPFMTTSAKLKHLASRQREVHKARRATDRRPGAKSWRDYLSWLPPENPDDWQGFPPHPSKRLEDLPVKSLLVDNETILYRQVCWLSEGDLFQETIAEVVMAGVSFQAAEARRLTEECGCRPEGRVYTSLRFCVRLGEAAAVFSQALSHARQALRARPSDTRSTLLG